MFIVLKPKVSNKPISLVKLKKVERTSKREKNQKLLSQSSSTQRFIQENMNRTYVEPQLATVPRRNK